MRKWKQRKAAFFLVICMVLSLFSGIPVQADDPDEGEGALEQGLYGQLVWLWKGEISGNNGFDTELETEPSKRYFRFIYVDEDGEETPLSAEDIEIQYQALDAEDDTEPVTEAEATYQDKEFADGEELIEFQFKKVGQYIITYDDSDAEGYEVNIRIDFPGIAVYTQSEKKEEYYVDTIKYERGTTTDTYYIIPNVNMEEEQPEDFSYTVTVQDWSDESVSVTIDGDTVSTGEDATITLGQTGYTEMTISAESKGDGQISFIGEGEYDYLGGYCDIWETGLVISGAWTEWDEESQQDIYIKEHNFWKTFWGDPGHVMYWLGYWTDGEDEPEAVDRVSVQYENEASIEVNAIKGHSGFFEFEFDKIGKYTITYNNGSSVDLYVDYPPVGFYRDMDKTMTNWISNEDIWNYPLWKSDQKIASNTVYLNISDRVLYDEATHGTLDWDDEEEDEHYSAFELNVSRWIGEERQILTLSYDKDGQPTDDISGKYLTVTSEGDGWYKLRFNTDDLTVGDGDDSWEPDWFNLRVITANADEEANRDGDIWEVGMAGPYQKLSLGKLSVYEGSSEEVYSGEDVLSVGAAIYPDYHTFHFGTYEIDEETNNVTFVEIQPNLSDMTIKRGELNPDDWSEIVEWKSATKGKDFEYEKNSSGVNFAFYYQNDYEITIDGQTVTIHPFLTAVEFFDTPVRPGDPERIENLVRAKTINKGETGTVYALSHVDENAGYAVDTETMEFKARVNEKEVTGEDTNKYFEIGDEVRDDGNLIGYAIEITDQEQEDFVLVVEALNNDGEKVDREIPIHINITALKIATPPTKTTYTAGEKFDPAGMVVNAVYKDGYEEPITGYTITPAGVLAATDQKVTITYSGKTVEQAITVKAAASSGDPTTEGPTTEGPTTEGPTTQAPAVPAKGTPIEDTKSDGSYTVSSSDSAEPTVEYKAPKNKNAKEAKIPDTIEKDGVTYKVTSIAPNAFKGNKTVTKVTIGNNVITIGKNAFSGCTKLKTVTIGKNVTTIGASAFKGCSALTKVTIPAKTTKIGKDAFNGCKKLKTVTIGKNVTTIEANAFKGCTALKKITIPAKTTKIGANAFSGCKNLKTITIKSTKLTSKSFAKNAFKGLSSKTVIKVPKKKKAAYAKLLKKAGFKGTVK